MNDEDFIMNLKRKVIKSLDLDIKYLQTDESNNFPATLNDINQNINKDLSIRIEKD